MMHHQFWITKQTLSQKFGRKEDECIVSSDAELDAKLELFRNIQMSCNLLQRIIDKYQESICYLSQETNSMGRFLKENSEEDKTKAGEAMLIVGKALIFCAQQQVLLHEPLMRFYQELETFRQRAIGDTLQNVVTMEKARTEYRAALSWMKNVSQQLDPDTSKQLEKFKKVQDQVRRGKRNFDKLALDCLQKVDLLAAARCNMLNHTLNFYHNKFITYTDKSAKTFSSTLKTLEEQKKRNNEIQIKTLITERTGTNNKPKKTTNENLLMSENQSSLIDTADETAVDALEKLREENDSDNGEKKDASSSQWESSTLQTQSQTPEYFDELQKALLSECKNILSEISVEETRSTDFSKIDWNTEDSDSFLPSALLKQSLQSATTPLKPESKSSPAGKGNEQSNKNHSIKPWMNLFEELDPLSNNSIDKAAKQKNSFV